MLSERREKISIRSEKIAGFINTLIPNLRKKEKSKPCLGVVKLGRTNLFVKNWYSNSVAVNKKKQFPVSRCEDD